MDSSIVYVRSLNENLSISDFFNELHKSRSISQNFGCSRLDATWIRHILRDYISEHGISSLFHFSITCDAVLHPGIHVDEIEELVLSFIRRLAGVHDLLIIDPYLYTTDPNCVDLFGKMMAVLAQSLTSVTFITNGRADSIKASMHEALRREAPATTIRDVVTDRFHDRVWIDAATNVGIVMGTSLNGIGKKIALIDFLSKQDAKETAALAFELIRSGD